MIDPEKNELAELLDFHGVARAGDVLVVEMDRSVTRETMERMQQAFGEVHKKFGVGIVVLDAGMRVAGKKSPLAG